VEIKMSYDFETGTPIYLQIIEKLKADIISKKYLPNDKLPSVREFSIELKVNPNTVQKALLELEDDGLIYTERTNGKFVTNDEEKILKTKEDMIKKLINEFTIKMQKLGLSEKDIIKIINKE
jgi:DNA-binding transcriptional regulator YhcF (GntR family)